MNWRIHAITFLILVFAVGILKFVWDHPQVILFFILGIIGLLAYGAIYIIVKTKMEKPDK